MTTQKSFIDWHDDGARIAIPPLKLLRSRGFWFSLLFSSLAIAFCVVGCVALFYATDSAAVWFFAIYIPLSALFSLLGLWMMSTLVHCLRHPVIIDVDSEQISIRGHLLFGRVERIDRASIRAIVVDDWGLWIVDGRKPRPRLSYHNREELEGVADAIREVLHVPNAWPCEPGEIPVKICLVEDNRNDIARNALLSREQNVLTIHIPGHGFGIRLEGHVHRPPRLRAFLQGCVPHDAMFAGKPFISPEHCEWIETEIWGRCLRIAPRGADDDHLLLWTEPIAELETIMTTFWDELYAVARIKI